MNLSDTRLFARFFGPPKRVTFRHMVTLFSHLSDFIRIPHTPQFPNDRHHDHYSRSMLFKNNILNWARCGWRRGSRRGGYIVQYNAINFLYSTEFRATQFGCFRLQFV